MKHYYFGDYVISGVTNAFDTRKTSYWISKNGFTVAFYCFTTNSKIELQHMLDNIDGFIAMFNRFIEAK